MKCLELIYLEKNDDMRIGKIIKEQQIRNNINNHNINKFMGEIGSKESIDAVKVLSDILTAEVKKSNSTTGIGEGLRYNQGKLRYDLVHPKAHADMVDVLTYGANKYSPKNWTFGLSWTSVIASLKRHLAAIEAGEDYDKETGLLHISHAACNAHFLNAFYYDFPQGDDRDKKFLKIPKIGLDIDGIIADYMGAWHELYPEILEFPNTWYDDRLAMERFDLMRKNSRLNDFYLNMKPLILSVDLPFDPHCYITSRPVDKKITETWLDYHNFPCKPVYSLEPRQSKVELAKDAGVEIFIEDSFDNFVDLNKNGIFTYLYTRSWNKKYDVGHMRINSLNDLPWFKK